MDLNARYFLLLVDISNSTGLAGKKFNMKMDMLESSLKIMNDTHKSELVLPLTISYGDEIAGLFNAPGNIFKIVAEIRGVFHPLTTIRFAVTKGNIARISQDIRKVGGNIFKVASESVNRLKQDDRFCSWQMGDIILDKALDSLCEISNALLNDMSEYQSKVFDLYKTGLSQRQVALKLKKYPQSVWNAVHRGKANHILNAEETINMILQNINDNWLILQK